MNLQHNTERARAKQGGWLGGQLRALLAEMTPRRLGLMMLGAAILTFGICNIHRRTGITEGGVLGLLLFVNHWTGLPASIVSPVLDLACYAMAWRVLGAGFLRRSLLSTAMIALWYKVWESLPPLLPDWSGAPLTAAVAGAVCVGVGGGADRAAGRLFRRGRCACAGHCTAHRLAAGPQLPDYRPDRACALAELYPGAAHRLFPDYRDHLVLPDRQDQRVGAGNMTSDCTQRQAPCKGPGVACVFGALRPLYQLFSAGGSTGGKVTRMVVPVPTVLFRSSLASCSMTMCLTMASPSPVPPVALLRLLSTR